MLADDRPMGVIVLERRNGRQPGVERRLLAVVERVAAMTALNLRNAVLLRRVQDLEERDALTGAANRRTFQASLQRALWTGGRRGDADVVGAVHRPRRLQDRQRHATATPPATRCWSPSPGGSSR